MKRLILVAAIAAAAVTTPAYAASNNFKMEVNYSSKNLTTRQDAEAEYEHIRKQVSERCAAEHEGVQLAGGFTQNFCVRRTMDRAVSNIGNPLLAEIHAQRR